MFGLFNNSTSKDVKRYAGANYEDPRIQAYLPGPLRHYNTDPILSAGIKNLGELLMNPGRMSGSVSDAIKPRLANESQSIATNFQGIMANQQGAGSRFNLPVSIKAALEAALNTQQERAQRGARNQAMTDSESLRRQDINNIFPLLQALNAFTGQGRGQAIQGFANASGTEQQDDSAKLQTIASMAAMAAMFMSNSRFKEEIEPVAEDKILDAIKALPVYSWKYKGDSSKHVGPLAEDFREKFGLGESADTIHYIDAIGTLMAATRALAKKVERMEAA